jgi:diguanylate cyclase (GGDEF)-like protein
MDHAAGTDDALAWIPAPAMWMDQNGPTAANEAAVALLGPADEVLASLPDTDRAALIEAVATVAQGGSVEAVTVRTGTTPPFRFVEFRLGRHSTGAVIALAHEVTERERLDAVIAEFATGVYVTDADLQARWIPRRVSESVGLPRERFVGSDVYERLHPDDVEPTRELVARARELPGVRCSRPMRVRQFDQPDVWWPIVTHLIWRGDDPAIGGLLVRFDMDLTAGVDERETELTAQSLVTLDSSSTTGALHLDLDGGLLQRSTRVREILRPLGDDGDLRWLDLLRPEDREPVRERLDAARSGTSLSAVEVAFVGGAARVWARVDAVPYRDTQGHVAGMFVNVQDLTFEREARDELAAAREELWHLANHDALTGLANRYQLADRLAAALEGMTGREDAVSTRPAVIVADLDRFKDVNDGHGHRIGDEVLTEAARRIASTVRPGDLVCRFGGDEFVVLCERVADRAELDALAERLVERFARPFVVDGLTVDIGISVGGAVAEPGDVDVPDALILRADRAMYVAKAQSRDR